MADSLQVHCDCHFQQTWVEPACKMLTYCPHNKLMTADSGNPGSGICAGTIAAQLEMQP